MKNKLSDLNNEWQTYLNSCATQLQEDIHNILTDKTIKYRSRYHLQDISALYFEYEYDYMDIVFWAENKKGDVITDILVLPTQRKDNAITDSKWKSFFPENIWREVIELEESCEDDDFYDLLDEYNEEKTRLFKEWFFNCWNIAANRTENIPDAYFSIHDTYFRTDLKTGRRINQDEISERYK